MANLIVCCDGTWNTPDQREDGLPAATNVVKIRRALEDTDADGLEQKAYYHPGVGTDGGKLDRLASGGLGKGLDDNVKSAYFWLARNYRPGSRIYFFGFSRGAYTVRSAAGMIGRCGLLDLSDPGLDPQACRDAVDAVFGCYRTRTPCIASEAHPFFHAAPDEAPAGRTPVHFLGVWDTVGALGIPEYIGIPSLFSRRRHQFHDTELGATVLHARHAVALDERRESFLPTLWSNAATHADARQVWFPGVHGDVGGGYARTDLSDGALRWMMQEATDQGLVFRPGVIDRARGDAEGVMHDSLHGFYRGLQTRPRPVPAFDDPAAAASLHESSVARHATRGFAYDDYWKTRALERGGTVELEVFALEPWNYTGLYLRRGSAYQFRATGRWLDKNAPCGPEGMQDGRFHPDEIAQTVSSVWSLGEEVARWLPGNEAADFRLTRRRDDLPWFCLCGAVANGGIADGTGELLPHETFLIGEGVTYCPLADGYLYCFANDAWSFYGNNRGSVHVTVEHVGEA